MCAMERGNTILQRKARLGRWVTALRVAGNDLRSWQQCSGDNVSFSKEPPPPTLPGAIPLAWARLLEKVAFEHCLCQGKNSIMLRLRGSTVSM